MRELNKKNEMIALRNMIEQLRSMQNDIFDYTIEVFEPRFESDNKYLVPISVDVITNPNYENFIQIISNTLGSLSLTKEEIINYNMPVTVFTPYQFEGDIDESPNSGFFFLRSNRRDLEDIVEQICSIYNNAQRSFYIRSNDDSHKEWSPSENDINKIFCNKERSGYIYFKTAKGKATGLTSGFRVFKGYSNSYRVAFISHLFPYNLEELSSLKGFDVVKKSID